MPIQLTGVLMVITFFRNDTNRPVNKKTDINRFFRAIDIGSLFLDYAVILIQSVHITSPSLDLHQCQHLQRRLYLHTLR